MPLVKKVIENEKTCKFKHLSVIELPSKSVYTFSTLVYHDVTII
jgi:hypothetical protein